MKRALAILALTLAVLAVPVKAVAACTTQTVFLPDGKVLYCQTCCFNGVCTTNCTGGE